MSQHFYSSIQFAVHLLHFLDIGHNSINTILLWCDSCWWVIIVHVVGKFMKLFAKLCFKVLWNDAIKKELIANDSVCMSYNCTQIF